MNNIIKRKWNQNSMVIIEDLQGMAFQAESGGHTFQISGIDGEGNTVALSGTPAGVMLRSDGQDVALTCSASGGVVSATLPANAYSVPGRFGLTIFLTSDGQKTAIYAAVGTVSKTSSGTVAPPAGSDVVDLVNRISAAIAAIPASYNSCFAPAYSTSGLYSVGQYVTYDGKLYRCNTAITTAETWTAAHWTQTNLGADVYDLKSAIDNIDGVELVNFTDGYIISNGSSVDITDIKPTANNYKYAIVNCQENDEFTLTGSGGASTRLWCFIKANGESISKSGENASLNMGMIKAPANASKLVINTNANNSFLIKGRTNAQDIANIKGALSTNTGASAIEFIYGYQIQTNVGIGNTVDVANPVISPSAKYAIIPCAPGDVFTLNLVGGDGPRAFCLTDSSYTVISVADESVTVNNGLYTVPSGNGAYLILNSMYAGLLMQCFKGETVDNRLEKTVSVNLDSAFTNQIATVLSDLNNARKNVIYRVAAASAAQLPNNTPSWVGLAFLVARFEYYYNDNGKKSYDIQVIIDFKKGVIVANRTYNNGSWTEWTEATVETDTVSVVSDSAFTSQISSVLSNMNDAVCNKVYRVVAASSAQLPSNVPSWVGLKFLTIRYKFTYLDGATKKTFDNQLIIEQEKGGITASRSYANGTWSDWLKGLTNKGYYVVSVDGKGDFTTISGAVNNTSNGDTILIMPGTYNETVRMWTKDRNLVGVNRDKCIIYAGSGLYENPAIEMNIGSAKNLTFISGNDNDLSEDSVDRKAYSAHIEKDNAQDYSCRFENCKFVSALNAAVGIGCRYNQTIVFDNCYFETQASKVFSSYISDFIDIGGLLFHNDGTANMGGNGLLQLNNCEIVGKTKAIMTESLENGSFMTVRFKNCIAHKANESTDSIVGYWGPASKGTSPYFCGTCIKMDKFSFGNLSEEINFADYWN